MSDGIEAGLAEVARIIPVSRETGERLAAYVDLLRRWQPAQNLVAGVTLSDVWRRHVADSARLMALAPPTAARPATWADLGSGGGFPGLVTAILLADAGAGHVHLVESNRRKCAFLREAIRATGARAEVVQARVEDAVPDLAGKATHVSARAFAPLDRLVGLAEPLIAAGAVAYLHKGRDIAAEVDVATNSWVLDMVEHDDRIGDDGVILEIRGARRRD